MCWCIRAWCIVSRLQRGWWHSRPLTLLRFVPVSPGNVLGAVGKANDEPSILERHRLGRPFERSYPLVSPPGFWKHSSADLYWDLGSHQANPALD
jgi:hypothetical protein